MSKDLNQCNFIGRLGKEIDPKFMPNGTAVINFSIACGDDYKDKNTGQKVEQTNWINLVAFEKKAEVISQYLKKGDQIFVSAKQRTRKYTDQGGQDKWVTENIINEFKFLGSSSGPSANNSSPIVQQPATYQQGQQQRSAPPQNQPMGAQQQGQQAQQQGGNPDGYDDDIPF